jgi:hypothetical protein
MLGLLVNLVANIWGFLERFLNPVCTRVNRVDDLVSEEDSFRLDLDRA